MVAFVGYNPWESVPAFMVVIAHGGGVSTLYAHAASYVVSQGQVVKKGQVIGHMGSTGFALGTHLHWEVWQGDWNPVDPRSYL